MTEKKAAAHEEGDSKKRGISGTKDLDEVKAESE